MFPVAFKDKCVWIGVWPVIASLRQARPLCRAYRHTSFAGHKIKGSDVLPRSGLYRAKEVKNNGELSIICRHQVWRQTDFLVPAGFRNIETRPHFQLTIMAKRYSNDPLLTSTLLTNPGLHWTFLEVARENFSNFLGFIILQVMVCSKGQSSLIPQYKRHRSQLSHQSSDLRLRRAASVGKQETRLSWSSYGPIISTAWKARTVGKLGMKLLELWTINKASQKQ